MQAEKRSAQEGLELAGVNEAERSGSISGGDAIRQRAAIKEKFVRQAEEAKAARLEEEQEARKEALRNTMLAAQAAQAALPGAVQEATAAERAAKAAPDKEKSDLEDIARRKNEVDDLLGGRREALDGYQMNLLRGGAAIAPAGSAAAKAPEALRQTILEKMDELEKERALLERQEATVKATREKTEADAKQKRTRADDLKKQVTGGRDASGKLFEDILQGDTDLRSFREHRGAVSGLEGRARALESGSEADSADRKDEERREKELRRRGPLTGGGTASGQSFGGSMGGDLAGTVDHSTEALTAYFAAVELKLGEQARQIDTGRKRLEQMTNSAH